jgi:GNAT superfamily N-acetyltransferase
MELRAPRSSGEWARYHEIRKRCIFEKYNGKGSQCYCEYDPGCPDEHEPVNHPLIFLADGTVIGTIRIDIKLEQATAVFRLVAIDDPWQGQGHGTLMLDMAETFARGCGVHRICLNSVQDAYGFYVRRGFRPARWVGCTRNTAEIPVVKEFTLPSMQLVAQSQRDPSRRHEGAAATLCAAGEGAV